MTAPAPITAVGTWMLDQLPNHLRYDEFFCRFVGLFGSLAEDTFDHADALPFLADPTITPTPMVRHLAGWLGTDGSDRSVPADRQRERLGRLGELIAWRGTRRGLTDLLEVLTGGAVEVDDGGGVFAAKDAPRNRQGHRVVRVRLATAGHIPVEHLVDVIADEIPAGCALDLWVDGSRVPIQRRVLRGRR